LTFFRRHILAVIILVSSVTFNGIHAQLCQGSLGDPLVNITFGAGTNPAPPLLAATTAYQYLANDCPNDGFYTVRNNTVNCFNNSWHSLPGDHTGDPNGYFMLVNASFQPSVFYLDTVKGLCSGSIYEFATWIINVLKPSACSGSGIQPNLTFTIENTNGTVLQTYNTGNIPSQSAPAWQQFGFFFATPIGVSDVVLRIFNNSAGGCGNDIALDDITFRPCGPLLSATVAGNPGPTITICEGMAQSFTFNGTVSAGFNNPSFQWQEKIDNGPWTDIPGATATSYIKNFPSATAPGIYTYRLSAAETGNMALAKCRVSSQPLTIKVAANPVTTVTSNSPLCEQAGLFLTATGGTSYQWAGPNGFTASGASASVSNVQPVHAGKYLVTVTNDNNCTHLDSVTVVVNSNPIAATSFEEFSICQGDNIGLSGSGGTNYKWIPPTGLSSDIVPDPTASPVDTMNYQLIVTNPDGCKDTTELTINVIERARADAGPDKYIIKGNSVQLAATALGQNINYIWSPDAYIDDVFTLQPVVAPPHDTTYILTVTSNEGCGVDIDSMHVFVYKDIYVPTAFTPDNNGLNDTWFIPALSAYPEFTISVFNRQGQILFYTKNTNKPWDGKYKGIPQPAGVYVYMIDIKLTGQILKGTLMLVR
jgi:gliding motility-associated-like protein